MVVIDLCGCSAQLRRKVGKSLYSGKDGGDRYKHEINAEHLTLKKRK